MRSVIQYIFLQEKCIPCNKVHTPAKVYTPVQKCKKTPCKKSVCPCKKSVPPCKKKVCPLREKCTPLGRKVYPPCKKNVPPLQEKCQEKCTPLLCLIMTLIYRHTCHTRGEARVFRIKLIFFLIMLFQQCSFFLLLCHCNVLCSKVCSVSIETTTNPQHKSSHM